MVSRGQQENASAEGTGVRVVRYSVQWTDKCGAAEDHMYGTAVEQGRRQ